MSGERGAMRFGVIGAGFWAGYQLAAWGEVEGARCIAVCDRDEAKAKTLAERCGVEKVYTDAGKMIRETGVEFVDIVTPPPTHRAMVEAAAATGVDVICQKPLAETIEDARAMVEAAGRAGSRLIVHENFRFQRPMRELKCVLESGEIGRVFRARIEFCSNRDVYGNQPALREMERFLLMDVGVHVLDVARCLFGEAESVYATTKRVNETIRGEDVATVMMRMAGGATVTCEMSYASNTEHQRFPETFVAVEGSEGCAAVGPGCRLSVTRGEQTRVSRCEPMVYGWVNPAYAVVQSSMVEANRHYLEALRSGERAETEGDDNLRTLAAVFAAYESAEKNRVIEVG